MESNFYLNIYRKKTSDELKNIAFDDSYADDSKLTAISILKERNEINEKLISIESMLINKRTNRVVNEIAEDKYSTFFERLIANFIDGVVISLIGLTFRLFQGMESVILISIISLISGVYPYLYNILLHGFGGQTIGKMFMGIKVFDKSEKRIISFKQALIRDSIPLGGVIVLNLLTFIFNLNDHNLLTSITSIIVSILLIWSILEIITLLFNSKRRALHDFIAGTVVLKIREI